MQANPLTLHVRLTKACNADCSYCSSWQESPDQRMRPKQLEKVVRFILDSAPVELGVKHTHLTVQFLGGEIALVPLAELKEHVALMKRLIHEYGLTCIVGAQSNLIVSERRAAELYDLFEGRIGTNIDLTSQTRTVKGDAERYRLIWKSADNYLRAKRSVPGAIYVVEPDKLPDAMHHLLDSAKSGRAITFRPIFVGGIKDVRVNPAQAYTDSLTQLFDRWFLKLPIIAEPFFQLCENRISEVAGLSRVVSTTCAYQSDCTKKSINIDPNGDLHVCLEMADAGLTPIGNGLSGQWDRQALSVYASRPDHLQQDCLKCPYFKSCQGGCMYESIAQGAGAHGRSTYCHTWKAIFARIDQAIEEHGAEFVHNWLQRVATRHANFRNEGMARAVLCREVVSATE